MNQALQLKNYRITLAKRGSETYSKRSYPVHCGVFSEVDCKDFTFHFNLNHEIIRILGKGRNWPHPHEWLKRTMGNDWIYYSTGGYTGVLETTGEYYLPNLPYPTNRYMGGKPFQDRHITAFIDGWPRMLDELAYRQPEIPDAARTFLTEARANTPGKLAAKAEALFNACGGRVSVLPPDTRHVDYNVIPLTIARGCLYKCRFCRVKSDAPFMELTAVEISKQLETLAQLYRDDLANYNSLFLGEHDALQANPELICSSISEAYARFRLTATHMRGSNVFLFGSVTSLLNAPDRLFRDLDNLPGNIYINVGLESADQETLDLLGKPLTAAEVCSAFERMQEINDRYATIEVTGNFVIDDTLPPRHYQSLLALIRGRLSRTRTKGSIYLSPLRFDQPSRSKLFDFYRTKVQSRLPLYLYIIQRL